MQLVFTEQKTSVQGYAHGMPIRKVIRNKLIDVTKLVNDMHFVAEADRYKSIIFYIFILLHYIFI